jgi:hypothetical protein
MNDTRRDERLVDGYLAALWDGDDIVVVNRIMNSLHRYTVDYLEECEKGYLDGRFGKVPTHLEMALNLSGRCACDVGLWESVKSSEYDRIMRRDPFGVVSPQSPYIHPEEKPTNS